MRALMQLALALALALATPAPGGAQTPDAGAAPPGADTAATELSELLSEVEAVEERLLETDRALEEASSDGEKDRRDRIESLRAKIEAERAASDAQLDEPSSRADLEAGELRWQGLLERLDREKEEVEASIAELESRRTELRGLIDRWTERRDAWQRDPNISPEVRSSALERVREVLQALRMRAAEASEQLEPRLQLQSTLAEARREASGRVASYRGEIEALRSQILAVDSPPIWRKSETAPSMEEHAAEAQSRLRRAFTDFIARHGPLVPLHAALILALLGGAAWVWWWRRGRDDLDPRSDEARLADRPFSVAIVLGLVASLFFYARMPFEVMYVLGLVGLVPVIRFSSRLAGPPLDRMLWALGALFVAHRLYLLLGTDIWLGRVLLILTGSIGVGLVTAVVRSPARRAIAQRHRVLRLVGALFPAFGVLMVVGVLAEVVGLASLADVLVGGSLLSLYAAVLLGTLAMILLTLLRITLRSGLGQRFRSVRLHGDRIDREIRWWLQVAFTLWWIYEALRRFDVADVVLGWLDGLLRSPIMLGSASFRLLDGVLLVLTLWLSLQVARLIRFVLEEEVLPPLPLARGVPVAISRGVSYLVVALGFLLSVVAAGISLGQLTVLFGAFGVGIGFGLQNLVNNFVSGLILIFERPIAVGDLVEFGNQMGHVQTIGIRASVVRTFSGAELIVPNGDLVSFQVVNWNLSDRRRRVEIQVMVPIEADPEPAIDLMVAAAAEHPNVTDDPEPKVNVRAIEDGTVVMDLWCWTTDTSVTISTKSELTLEIARRFREAGVSVAVPRRALRWEEGPRRELAASSGRSGDPTLDGDGSARG